MNGHTRWAVDSRNMKIIVKRMVLCTPFLIELLNVDIHIINNVKYMPKNEDNVNRCCHITGPDIRTIEDRFKYGPEQMALSNVHHGWDSRDGG